MRPRVRASLPHACNLSTTAMDEKSLVYQETVVLPEQQAVLDAAFTMVGPREVEERQEEVVAIFGKPWNPSITAELLDKFPNVRVVSTHSAGYEHIDVEACRSRGVRIGAVGTALSSSTADMAFALLLASALRITELHALATSPSWTTSDDNLIKGVEVSGGVLGIVGMGRIGLEVAKRARGFEMSILYHNRNRRPKEIEDSVSTTYVPSLHELLSRADFVVAVAPGTKENYHMFDSREFSAMKSTAVFVNIGRGNLVNHTALAEALQRGEIGSAGLDVTEPEPLPRDHPLLSLDNVVITPHRGKINCSYAAKHYQIGILLISIVLPIC